MLPLRLECDKDKANANRRFPFIVSAGVGVPARRHDRGGVPGERVHQEESQSDGALCARQEAPGYGGPQLFCAT